MKSRHLNGKIDAKNRDLWIIKFILVYELGRRKGSSAKGLFLQSISFCQMMQQQQAAMQQQQHQAPPTTKKGYYSPKKVYAVHTQKGLRVPGKGARHGFDNELLPSIQATIFCFCIQV